MSTRTYRPLPMHRISYSDLTEEQVAQALRPAATGPGGKAPLSSALAGRRLKIVTDEGGPTLEYNFRTDRVLELSENGGKAVKAGYGALETRSLVLLSHMIPSTPPDRGPGTPRGYTLVIDLHTRIATVFEVFFSGYAGQEIATAREAKREPQFKK